MCLLHHYLSIGSGREKLDRWRLGVDIIDGHLRPWPWTWSPSCCPRSFSGFGVGFLAILSIFATSLSSFVQNLCTRNYLEISLEAFCNMGRGLGFVVFASCLLAMLWGGHRLKITHLVVPQRTLARFLKKIVLRDLLTTYSVDWSSTIYV